MADLVSTPPVSPVSTKGAGYQRSEIIKIFKTVDVDGSGSIEKDELAGLMTHVLGHAPTPDGVEFVRKMVDKDDNNTIEQDEFVDAILGWIKGNSSAGVSDSPSKRVDLHIQIKQFFQQTAHQDQVLTEHHTNSPSERQLRDFFLYGKTQIAELLAEVEGARDGEAPLYDPHGWRAGLPETSKARKVAALESLQKCYHGDMDYFWKDMLRYLVTGEEPGRTQSMEALLTCLGLLEAFPLPKDRYAISALLHDVFYHCSKFKQYSTASAMTISDVLREIVSQGNQPTEMRVKVREGGGGSRKEGRNGMDYDLKYE